MSLNPWEEQILNSIKSQLLTAHTFFHLPWAAWDAPGGVASAKHNNAARNRFERIARSVSEVG